MDNSELVSSFLRREGLYPEGKPGEGGLRLSQVCLQGAPADLIGLADLLVSLALSGEAHGQHWHIDELTLMDEESEIPELALLRE